MKKLIVLACVLLSGCYDVDLDAGDCFVTKNGHYGVVTNTFFSVYGSVSGRQERYIDPDELAKKVSCHEQV